jgi:multidrug efflux pump subunit AcrB
VRRAIAWFAENHVAANLLMGVLVIGGLLTLPWITQKEMPDVEIEMITVSVEYRGAAPEEVEEGVCIRVEEELEGIEGIDKIRSTASEGRCVVVAELLSGADVNEALDDVKNRVDALDTLPEETEKPIISQVTLRRSVADIAVSGPLDERGLKVLGQRIRDEIAALPGVTQVELTNVRPYEVSIEVSERMLRRHGLTFDQVAQAVRRSSLDLPGGSVKTEGGEILLRTKGQAYWGPQFEEIVVLTRSDGTRITVAEVATVRDGFEDTDQQARFDGQPAVMVRVFRVGEQDVIDISDKVKAYVAEARARLPEGVALTIWRDSSRNLRARLDTLFRNGRVGLLLVIATLTLFLRPRLAFWVTLGVPIALLGALWTIPAFGITINSISTFAFIMVLGILVDDAVVVGENVYTHQQRGDAPLEGAVQGTQEVAIPVIFGVLTTVAAFSPLLFVPGVMGQILWVMGTTVMICLAYSLVESQLVLPAHLAHSRDRGPAAELLLIGAPALVLVAWMLAPSLQAFGLLLAAAAAALFALYLSGRLDRLAAGTIGAQEAFGKALGRFSRGTYRRALEHTMEWRYVAVAVAIALLLWTAGVLASGRMYFSFFPPLEADYVSAQLTMPQGTPARVTAEAVAQIEAASRALGAELAVEFPEQDGGLIKHVQASVGEQPFGATAGSNPTNADRMSSLGAHLGEVTLELVPSEDRRIRTSEVASRWRELTGPVPDAVELLFSSSLFSIGEAVNIQLQGPNVAELQRAAERLEAELTSYPGVIDIADSFRAGKKEIKLSILATAEMLGLTQRDLARQVRQAFYGEEAQRIQRGRDDVRVMVRYPIEERRSLGNLESMRLRAPDGTEVPFTTVARADLGRGFAAVRRSDRQRVVNVTADVDRTQTTANEVVAAMAEGPIPEILADYPGMSYRLEGIQREQNRSFGALLRWAVIALFAIYALLAVPLRSYLQPLVIMAVIPFGVVGAVGGHLIMGKSMAFMSVTGLVAASGVVVNASLVLVHWVNGRRAAGIPLTEAVVGAGVARFRPIVLTSLTTFLGLSPLMLERSVQAQFLVPMGISLAFGVLLASIITLLVVPSGYLIAEDLREWMTRIRGRMPRTGTATGTLPVAARE